MTKLRSIAGVKALSPLGTLPAIEKRRRASPDELLCLAAEIINQAASEQSERAASEKFAIANYLIDHCTTAIMYDEDIEKICEHAGVKNPL